jgi:hypothetical protein
MTFEIQRLIVSTDTFQYLSEDKVLWFIDQHFSRGPIFFFIDQSTSIPFMRTVSRNNTLCIFCNKEITDEAAKRLAVKVDSLCDLDICYVV